MVADLDTRITVAPGKLPVLGHIAGLLRRPLDFLVSLHQIGDLVEISLGTQPALVVTEPALVYKLLTSKESSLDKGRFFQKFQPLTGNGLATSSGPFHMQQRRLCQQAFTRPALSEYLPIMVDHACRLADSWNSGQRIDLTTAIDGFTAETTVDAIFSTDLNPQAVADVVRLLPVVFRSVAIRTLAPEFWCRLPTPGNRRFYATCSQLRQLLDKVVDSRSHVDNSAVRKDLLSFLLEASDPETGGKLTAEQTRDEMVGFLVAGTETSASTLGGLFYELSRHPDIEQRIHAEIDSVLGGRRITESDLPKFEYTNRVIMETLRLHTPPWILMRRTRESIELGLVQVPANTEIIYSPLALHHDPLIYPDPQTFDPDRWLRKPERELPKGSFIPFGAGRHKCIGASFANMEIMAFVATIGAQWRLIADPPIERHTKYRALARYATLPMITEPR